MQKYLSHLTAINISRIMPRSSRYKPPSILISYQYVVGIFVAPYMNPIDIDNSKIFELLYPCVVLSSCIHVLSHVTFHCSTPEILAYPSFRFVYLCF